jgi:hypothetical protein
MDQARTGFQEDLASALRAPVPRTPEQIRLIVGRGGRFYRTFAFIMWSVVLLVPAVVGATTPGREIATFFEGLMMTSLMFGLPCQIFITVNRRRLVALARSGLVRDAVVSRAVPRGRPGRQIVDATLDLARADGGKVRLRVSGLPTLPPVGTVYSVLVDETRPKVAGVVAPPVGIFVARVNAA